MRALVCVKRVPMTGGRIVLTEDALAIETKHLGFAVSPHEECGVEEAVRLVEQHGGEAVVVTLGPADAEEQLRDAMAIGIDRGIHLVTGGEEWDPEATAAAIVEAIRADEAASGPFDLIFFGNESADSGGFQVGLRVAYALGRPCATGLKSVVVDGGVVRCEQEIGGGRDVYELPLPAVVTVLEGLNLPRYPSVPGRMRAGRKPLDATTPTRPESRLALSRLVVPAGEARQAEVLGRGPDAAAAVVDLLEQIGGGIVNLVLVEHADGVATDVSLQAVALAAQLGGETQALLIGPGGADAATGVPVDVAHVAEHPALDAFAPDAWATIICELTGRTGATAVVAPGTGPATDAMARAAVRLGEPLAANVTALTPGKPLSLTRLRWGGSLLEEAELHASRALLTVAPHTVAAVAAGAPGSVETFMPELSDSDLVVRVRDHVAPPAGGVSLADAKVVVTGGRGVGSAGGFVVIEELAALLGGAVGCSRAVTMSGWRPHTDQVGQTGNKIAPEIYIACGVSGATQHIAGAKGAKRILAVNTDPEAPIMSIADYAVVGDLHEVVPAISAELRRRQA